MFCGRLNSIDIAEGSETSASSGLLEALLVNMFIALDIVLTLYFRSGRTRCCALS